MTLELDYHIIDYSAIRDDIAARISEMRALSLELSQYMTTDEGMIMLIITEYQERAAEIAKEIAVLRQQNKHALAYTAFSLEIMNKHNITVSQTPAGLPSLANTENVQMHENAVLQGTIESLKRDFNNENITAAEFENLKKRAEKAREARITDIKNVQSELRNFIESFSRA